MFKNFFNKYGSEKDQMMGEQDESLTAISPDKLSPVKEKEINIDLKKLSPDKDVEFEFYYN